MKKILLVLPMLAQRMDSATTGFTLLAIPFFILASCFMSTGGVAKRLIRFAIASVGHLQGGLAIASVMSCMMFAALSGSSPATVVAIGTIAIAVGEEADTLEEVHEPFLIMQGFLKRTPRGRMAMPAAYTKIGAPLPPASPDTPPLLFE